MMILFILTVILKLPLHIVELLAKKKMMVDLFLYTMSSCFQKTELKENISKIILLSQIVLKGND